MTDHDAAEVTRRSVLRTAAVGGVALPLLAACGGGSSGAPASGGSGPATVPAADVPVGGGKILTAQQVVVTQPTKGDFKAFSAVCTHQKCLVGSIEGGQIVCPCHGSHYSIKDGSVISGPAPLPLPAKKTSVSGGQISVS
jgi:nitrite reductase/ring-hydroxylating ferredoxin subunit